MIKSPKSDVRCPKSGTTKLSLASKFLPRVVAFSALLSALCIISPTFILTARESSATTSDIGLQTSDLKKWREAEPGYRYSFPRDHAAHKEYGIEWWYYTGNLASEGGRRFGYQLTFFRVGVVPEQTNPSRWAVRDLYMAHFAVSDIERQEFRWFERINRAGIGWAGAEESVYHVWNEDWRARMDGSAHTLNAREDGFQIELRLAPSKLEVIHGQDEISRKGSSAGNASHYYSLTRLETSGSVMINGESFDVTGLSWMDHEFGTSFLEQEQTGWDWFSIQLDDGRELMMFQIRRRDGSIDPRSSGTLIEKDGRATHIPFGEFSFVSGAAWSSTASNASYPTRWTIELPRFSLRLNINAAFAGQELRAMESTGVTYWEGSVAVEGTDNGRSVAGRGYLEMTGYAGRSMGAILR